MSVSIRALAHSALRSALLLFLLACSKAAEPGSCFRERDNACVEYDRAEAAAGKRMCSGFKWLPGDKSCPTSGRLGTCSNSGRAELLYAGAPSNFTASSARSACELGGGVFTPQ